MSLSIISFYLCTFIIYVCAYIYIYENTFLHRARFPCGFLPSVTQNVFERCHINKRKKSTSLMMLNTLSLLNVLSQPQLQIDVRAQILQETGTAVSACHAHRCHWGCLVGTSVPLEITPFLSVGIEDDKKPKPSRKVETRHRDKAQCQNLPDLGRLSSTFQGVN